MYYNGTIYIIDNIVLSDLVESSGILQKHFKKDHVHMHLWTRFYGMPSSWGSGGDDNPGCMYMFLVH